MDLVGELTLATFEPLVGDGFAISAQPAGVEHTASRRTPPSAPRSTVVELAAAGHPLPLLIAHNGVVRPESR